MVLLNDFKLQWKEIQDHVLKAVSQVGESGYLILGPRVKEFEQSLSSRWGLSHTIGCANGLDAIEIGLRCLGLQPGQKVLTTPLSAFATTLAILRIGAIPVFVDVDSSGLVDLELAEDVFKKNTDINFFVPVHLFGHSLNLSKLSDLKNKYSLKIVEDCAQSIGAMSFGELAGSVGQACATSFYPTKNLGCYGDGGAVLTSSSELAEKARCLRDYGQTQKYLHSEYGLNSRLDEVQAAILSMALLPRLNDWTERRKQIAKFYLSQISNSSLILPSLPEGSESVWHLFPVQVKSQRESFMEYLKTKGINSGIHYPILIPDQPLFLNRKYSFENKTDLAKSKSFANNEVSLPIHPYLTQDELNKVVSACNEWKP